MNGRLFTIAVLFSLLITSTGWAQSDKSDQPDYKLSSWRLLVRKVTPELQQELDQLEKKPRQVTIDKECDQESFAKVCQWDWFKKLEVNRQQLTDLSVLGQLENLEQLKFRSSGMKDKPPVDLSVLKDLSNLKELDCYATKVTNTEALRSLPGLTNVSLYMSAVDSIDFLDSTPNITVLNLYGFKHTFPNYEPVVGLEKLQELNIYMNKQATDEKLAVLKNMKTLEKIRMSNCSQLTNLDFLSGATNMKHIHANWCAKLTDCSVVESMPNLITLAISKIPATDFSFLGKTPALETLDISRTSVADIGFVANLPNLKFLDIGGTKVTDLGPVKEATALETLEIDNTEIVDLSPLTDHPKLRTLNLEKTNITDYSPLLTCKNLKSLRLPKETPEERIAPIRAAFPKAYIFPKK